MRRAEPGWQAGPSRDLEALQRRRPAGLAGRARSLAGWPGGGSPGPAPGAARGGGGGGPGTDQGPNAAPVAGGRAGASGAAARAGLDPGRAGQRGGCQSPRMRDGWAPVPKFAIKRRFERPTLLHLCLGREGTGSKQRPLLILQGEGYFAMGLLNCFKKQQQTPNKLLLASVK